MIVTPLEFAMINAAKATALAALNASTSALAQIEAVAALATLPPPSMAYLPHVLARAGGDDWTLFDTIEGAPVFADGKAILNGTTDALVATLDLDYAGKAVFVVAKVTGAASTRSAVFQINPGTTAGAVGIDARAAGEFNVHMRLPASPPWGATLVPSIGPANNETNIIGVPTLVGIDFADDGCAYVINGASAFGKTARPASIPMKKLVVGRSAGGYRIAGEVLDVVVLGSTDPAVINSYLADAKARFGVAVPCVTPLMGKTIAIVGDSVAAGLKVPSVNLESSWRLACALAARRAEFAIAGGQICPAGLTDPAKLALCGARVMTRARLEGKAAVVCFAGSNDWNGADGVVPIGAYGDVTEATFHGSLHLMREGFLANRDAGAKLYICTTVNLAVTVQNTTGATVLDFDAALRAFVAQTADPDVALIDTRLAGLILADFVVNDFHPNEFGHEKIALCWAEGIATDFGL